MNNNNNNYEIIPKQTEMISLKTDVNDLENPYSFSDKQFNIEKISSLAKSTIVKSDLNSSEIEWALKRLIKIDQIGAILPLKIEKLGLNNEVLRDNNNQIIMIDNTWKQKAIEYTLKRVIDRGVLSRTKDGWFVKLIMNYKNKESKKDETLQDLMSKTDKDLETEHEEKLKK